MCRVVWPGWFVVLGKNDATLQWPLPSVVSVLVPSAVAKRTSAPATGRPVSASSRVPCAEVEQRGGRPNTTSTTELAVRTSEPLVPVTVNGMLVAPLTFAGSVTVSADCWPGVTVAGTNFDVDPAGSPATLSCTAPAKPLVEATSTTYVFDVPGTMVNVSGETTTRKSRVNVSVVASSPLEPNGSVPRTATG